MRTFEITLNNNELPAKVNSETGEIKTITPKRNNIPAGKEIHYSEGMFTKSYEKAWDYLLDYLTPVELQIVTRMSHMARPASNSLEPLNNKSTVQEIADTFHIHRNSVPKMFEKLLKAGVYAEFRFVAYDGIRHYWVLNPYISFKGKIINSALVDLFRETNIAKLCV